MYRERERERNRLHTLTLRDPFSETCTLAVAASALLPRATPPPRAAAAEGNEPVAMLENGTGSENLIVCSNCITTFDTFLNDNLRRLPIADRTPSVFSMSGCWQRSDQG